MFVCEDVHHYIGSSSDERSINVMYLRFTQVGAYSCSVFISSAVQNSMVSICLVPHTLSFWGKGEGREVSELSPLHYGLISCSL